MGGSVKFILSLLAVCAWTCDRLGAIEWGMDKTSEVLSTANLEPGNVEMGRIAGWSTWDPYVSLRVPADGIDAAKLTWLTVRLFSSAAADL